MKSKSNYKKVKFKDYTIKEINNKKKLLGKGGNAEVYLVEDREGNEFALKCLYKNSNPIKIKRFEDEIKIVTEIQSDIGGILPIIDYEINIQNDDKWYVMNIAKPLKEEISDNKDIQKILTCMVSLSKTLVKLHGKMIVHRDIKPSNLYYYNNNWCFSDFGLVDYPNKENEKLTKANEKIGNYSTIAPEMRRAGTVTDARPADVFSMGKTLWMLLTNSNDGFEGCYSIRDKQISLRNYDLNIPIEPFEKLLIDSTAHQANERITMKEFNDRLIQLQEIIDDQPIIYPQKNFEELSKEEEIFYNTANIENDSEDLIQYFNLEIYSEEIEFIKNGWKIGIDALKYIKYQLENDQEREFIVSPIHSWDKESMKFPTLRVWIKYKVDTAKFVTNIVYYSDQRTKGIIRDVNHEIIIESFYRTIQNSQEIQFNILDEHVKYIKTNAYYAK